MSAPEKTPLEGSSSPCKNDTTRREMLFTTARWGARIMAGLGLASFAKEAAQNPQKKGAPNIALENPQESLKAKVNRVVDEGTEEAVRSLMETIKKPEASLLRTTAESIAEFYVAKMAGTHLKKKGFRTGNQSITDLEALPATTKTAIKLFAVTAAPPVEELAFRLLPTMLWISQQDVGDRWDVGVVTSLVFAYMHNVKMGSTNIGPLPVPTLEFYYKSIPI